MNNIIKISFFSILVMFNLFSQDIGEIELNLDTAVLMGLKNSADLKIENINLSDAKINMVSSYNNFIPEMKFETGLLKYNDD